ncbi:hypothetical protein BTR14_10835 [Rhizobium rhizosphaerae]|uniref:Uncharacterized protein n=1 Tax=Xaviernesmea rhizosphaerae TaxID=1672749 RepID=A0ABX3PES3_9HYPH|nr:hypothetical protein [Xaviernesmea rhizosphaerae]OQP86500.1 hypothetical protein BTR14_10835 [Xaviernesmea rhizosphaerae]
MSPAFYADTIADLRRLFTEIDRAPETVQTCALRFELAAADALVVYETTRRKGLTDSLFYGRPAGAEAQQTIPQVAAFAAIDRFLALGQFLALTGEGEAGKPLDKRYPHCAVSITYRRKGQPKARAMRMVFIGFNDDADALAYGEGADDGALVIHRPHVTAKAFEWR